MNERLTISVDAMGGDAAPEMVVEGVDIASASHPAIHFLLFGDERRLRPLLDRLPKARAASTLRHTEEVVGNDAKPSVALRVARGSSMRLAIEAVRAGEAGAVVSAGNTGALMAMAKFVFKTLPGITRPAIAAVWPSRRGDVLMLDLGANVECDAQNLVQFAVMGEVIARVMLGKTRPTIGLLNVGSEDLKGVDAVREAAAVLRASPLAECFQGFVEGNDITKGVVDVVVTDGFTGNVAIKTAEGTVHMIVHALGEGFRSSLAAKLGYLLARPAFERFRSWIDPRRYNGAVLVGLNGITVKSHGGTDAIGFAHALGVAIDMLANRFNEKIKEELELIDLKGEKTSPAQAV
ncbi:MAG: phosphate acyltransferase PlsX [Proteobacteria bacterium]|nr:phosphate acyltransferase PlsX [Pseudomonadota bacterium]